jgi:hypothetical protein
MNLGLQVGRVPELSKVRPENDCAGEGQQQLLCN